MPLVIRTKFYTVSYANKYASYIKVFGDNMIAKGTRGQAVIRYCPGAFGIPTKRYPSTTPESYFKDADYDEIKPILDEKFKILRKALRKNFTVVWPAAGIGTGLADLENKSPRINKYINQQFSRLVVLSRELQEEEK